MQVSNVGFVRFLLNAAKNEEEMSGYQVVKHAGIRSVKYYDEIGKRHYKRLFKHGDVAPSRQTK